MVINYCCCLIFFSLVFAGCGGGGKSETAAAEEEAIARTEFTDRIENFFEYEPLKAGKPSQFRIHLTDLSDGSPVEKADVTMRVVSRRSGQLSEVAAKVGKVNGIYVAELQLPDKGTYDIEFRIKNAKVDERLPLKDFEVE
jgi:hypothetical protein